jgi:predicted amidophosphoribosyltransferase
MQLIAQKVMLCAACRKQISESDNFCPHCGSKVAPQ